MQPFSGNNRVVRWGSGATGREHQQQSALTNASLSANTLAWGQGPRRLCMRRLFTVLACATLVVGLGAPAWGNGSGSQTTDQPITAMGKGGHHGGHRGGHGDRGYRRGGRG